MYGLKFLGEDNNLIMSHSEIYPSDVDIIDYDIFVHIWTIQYYPQKFLFFSIFRYVRDLRS